MDVNCIISASKSVIFINAIFNMYFSHRKNLEIILLELDGNILHDAFKAFLSSSFTFVIILHLEIDTHFLAFKPRF